MFLSYTKIFEAYKANNVDPDQTAPGVHNVCLYAYVMPDLHYVPGSHGSQKRSLP